MPGGSAIFSARMMGEGGLFLRMKWTSVSDALIRARCQSALSICASVSALYKTCYSTEADAQ